MALLNPLGETRRAAVLCGGESVERDISLDSGLSVAGALTELGYEVAVIDPAARDPLLGGPTCNSDDLPQVTVSGRLPDIDLQRSRRQIFTNLTSGPVLSVLRNADLVIPALHGGWGGDGHIQGFLEMAEIPFTGSASTSCSLAWDKHRALRLLREAGVGVSRYVLHHTNDRQVSKAALDLLEEGPVVVKPVTGTSHGALYLAAGHDELKDAIDLSPENENLLITPWLSGQEFTVGVLGDQVLPPVEIEYDGPFYDYQAKNLPEASRRRCPADIGHDLMQRMGDQAKKAHRAVGMASTSYSRVDFRCDKAGELYCLEVNACPVLRRGSGIVMAAAADGLPYPALVERIIRLKFPEAAATGTPVLPEPSSTKLIKR